MIMVRSGVSRLLSVSLPPSIVPLRTADSLSRSLHPASQLLRHEPLALSLSSLRRSRSLPRFETSPPARVRAGTTPMRFAFVVGLVGFLQLLVGFLPVPLGVQGAGQELGTGQ